MTTQFGQNMQSELVKIGEKQEKADNNPALKAVSFVDTAMQYLNMAAPIANVRGSRPTIRPPYRVSNKKIIQLSSARRLGNNRLSKPIKGRIAIPTQITGVITGSPANVQGFKIANGLGLAISKDGLLYKTVKPDEVYFDSNGSIGYKEKGWYIDSNCWSTERPKMVLKLSLWQDHRKTLKNKGFTEVSPNHWKNIKNELILDTKGKIVSVIERQVNLSGSDLKIRDFSGTSDNMTVTYRGGLTMKLSKNDEGRIVLKLDDLKTMPSFTATGIKRLDSTPLISKSAVELSQIEGRMRPGRSASDDGFLGPDESLVTVLKNDQKTLSKHGITAAQLADVMKMFETIANLKSGEAISGATGVKVTFNNQTYIVGKQVTWSGGVENPITGRYEGDRTAYYVEKQGSQQRMVFNSLEPKLIAQGFFQGPTRSHRTDPEKLIKFFEAGQPPEALKAAIKKMGL